MKACTLCSLQFLLLCQMKLWDEPFEILLFALFDAHKHMHLCEHVCFKRNTLLTKKGEVPKLLGYLKLAMKKPLLGYH